MKVLIQFLLIAIFFFTACSRKTTPSASDSSSSSSSATEVGKKFLYYQKTKSAKDALQKVVNDNPKDANAIYWLGQAYLADEDIAGAKDIYQKALSNGINDPWIWIGKAHVALLEGGDINAAKQQFERAITATTVKGKANPDILNAIGRANADGGSKIGDPNYAIEKLKKAQQLAPGNPDIDINLGINYLKLGSQYGGEAVEAFREATVQDPKYARGFARIGRVYQSQNNLQSMNEWYNKAIAADPAYAPVYLYYFNYYKEKDVNAAKEYLDKYVKNSDQNCNTQAFVADYLFRAGNYNQSIDKLNQMAAGECKSYQGINLIYAYNYNRLDDSIQAKNYMQQYLSSALESKIEPETYAFAGTIFKNVSGFEDTAVTYLVKAMESDTVTKNKFAYADSIAFIYKKINKPQERLTWLRKSFSLNPNPSNFDIYNLGDAALDAQQYELADSMFNLYKTKYPTEAYGYINLVKSAQAQDTTGEKAVAPINDYLNFLMSDTAKNSATIGYYHAILGGYYANTAKNIDSAITEFQIAVQYDPSNTQYSQYLDILTKARDRAGNQSKKEAEKQKRRKK